MTKDEMDEGLVLAKDLMCFFEVKKISQKQAALGLACAMGALSADASKDLADAKNKIEAMMSLAKVIAELGRGVLDSKSESEADRYE